MPSLLSLFVSALPPQVVVDTMVDHLRREAEIGGYEAQAEASDRLAATYASLGRLVGAGPEGISLTTSATDAWLRGFLSIPLEPGDRILVAQAEYASNVLAVMSAARRVGATVEAVLPRRTAFVRKAAGLSDRVMQQGKK